MSHLSLQDTDVVNTAILTGRGIVMPVKLVTVEMDGQVKEVDNSVTCTSTQVEILKVRVCGNRSGSLREKREYGGVGDGGAQRTQI